MVPFITSLVDKIDVSGDKKRLCSVAFDAKSNCFTASGGEQRADQKITIIDDMFNRAWTALAFTEG